VVACYLEVGEKAAERRKLQLAGHLYRQRREGGGGCCGRFYRHNHGKIDPCL
jgi:hypothetical protein